MDGIQARGAHRLHDPPDLVWITKYRKRVLAGEVGIRVREVIRQICREEDVEILKGHVSKDHVHLLVSIPPQAEVHTRHIVEASRGAVLRAKNKSIRWHVKGSIFVY